MIMRLFTLIFNCKTFSLFPHFKRRRRPDVSFIKHCKLPLRTSRQGEHSGNTGAFIGKVPITYDMLLSSQLKYESDNMARRSFD